MDRIATFLTDSGVWRSHVDRTAIFSTDSSPSRPELQEEQSVYLRLSHDGSRAACKTGRESRSLVQGHGVFTPSGRQPDASEPSQESMEIAK